eukprot:scaffold39160_cov275-Amphora_coffeaeformis.AAC.3
MRSDNDDDACLLKRIERRTASSFRWNAEKSDTPRAMTSSTTQPGFLPYPTIVPKRGLEHMSRQCRFFGSNTALFLWRSCERLE